MSDKESPFLCHTREVLLESIQSQRDRLLAEEEKQASLFRKGKSPATTVDRERAAQLQRDMQQLAECWTDVNDCRYIELEDDRGRIPGDTLSLVACPDGSGQGPSAKAQSKSALPSTPNLVPFEAEEPVWDPMTSSYAYRETGFEPGPSNSGGGQRPLPNHDFGGSELPSAKVS